MRVQKQNKKHRVEKFLQKFDQKSKTDFFSVLFYHVFGRFSVRGVQKPDKKYRKNKSDPPTQHGGHRKHFFCRPRQQPSSSTHPAATTQRTAHSTTHTHLYHIRTLRMDGHNFFFLSVSYTAA
jgi:hypothetical protein